MVDGLRILARSVYIARVKIGRSTYVGFKLVHKIRGVRRASHYIYIFSRNLSNASSFQVTMENGLSSVLCTQCSTKYVLLCISSRSSHWVCFRLPPVDAALSYCYDTAAGKKCITPVL